MLLTLPTTLQYLLGLFLWPDKSPGASHRPLDFRLRHVHGVANDSQIIFSNVPTFKALVDETYAVSTRMTKSYRPSSFAAFSSARYRSMRHMQSEQLLWDGVEVEGPDVEKRETLLMLAKMASNSYYGAKGKGWYSLDGWNSSFPFGWEPSADGFRGHVFVSDDNSTVVLSIKGTSAGWLVGGGGPTVKKDKLNDNLLFSCCCARVGPTWYPVCDCYSGGYKCDQTCVERSLIEDSLFYPIGTNLYNNVTHLYPNANIWLVGHSLGGSLASLLGVTFGAPVVTFEAPGERMAATRLHLPSPPSVQHVTHIFHTADPLAMGTCNGVTSICAVGGYAMESRCHLGRVARYDTVSKLGWSVDARTHGIEVIIDRLLSPEWPDESGREVPPLEEEKDCVDCFSWEYGDYNKSLIGY